MYKDKILIGMFTTKTTQTTQNLHLGPHHRVCMLRIHHIDLFNKKTRLHCRTVTKPRFLMFGTLIFGYKANKNSATHSKLCTC